MKLRTIGLLAVICAGGCASKGAATMSPGSYPAQDDYRDYGGMPEEGEMGGDYAGVDDDMDMMEEPAPMDAPSRADESRTLFKRKRMGRRDRAAKSEMASPAPDAAASPVTTTAEPAKPEKAIEEQDPEIAARHIVYTAAMTVSVFNLAEAMVKAEALPDAFGGYISQMSEGHLVLRIPSKNLRPVMEELGEFGNIEQRSLQAMDVTAQFTDVESRIRALEETHKQLLELLSKARTVQEALQVRQTLDNIATELEVLKGQMRQMQNQISFSTLTVGLYERGPHTPIPSSNDPFPWVNDLGVEATEWK